MRGSNSWYWLLGFDISVCDLLMDKCVDWDKLEEFSSEITSKWIIVGINLLPNDHRDMIRELIDEGEKTDEEKCTLVLKRWIELSSTDDRSWGKLCSVLRSHKVKMDDLAAKMEDVSCTVYVGFRGKEFGYPSNRSGYFWSIYVT